LCKKNGGAATTYSGADIVRSYEKDPVRIPTGFEISEKANIFNILNRNQGFR
jgi:hypothetical protein